ncbi:MAG: MlaD family protein [Candidatus Omnitrophica bacterium]|nr:MlaD family protein [Candidatus Omnitrophota bacterium]
MIFGKTKMELKVGIFVFLGLVILFVFILSIGSFKTWTSGYHVNFIFTFVNGIKVGAPVRFAGVDVGEVKGLEFMPADRKSQKNKIRIDCWLKREIKIPVDSTVWVNTLGLLGEKYIEIIPGQNYGKCLAENESLIGQDPLPMHEVTVKLKQIAEDLEVNLGRLKNKEGTIGKLLYDDAIYKEVETMISDLRRNPWKLFWKTKEKKQ